VQTNLKEDDDKGLPNSFSVFR